MVNSFGVKCLCESTNNLRESPEEKIARLFNKGNDDEKMFVINILGMDLWANTHVHDGIFHDNLFSPIVQILGYALDAYGIMHYIVKEEISQSVKTTLGTLEIVPQSKILIVFLS